MRQLVDRDREDDEDAGDEVLVDDVDADQGQAVPEHPDDRGPDQRPDDGAPAAEVLRCADQLRTLQNE